MDRAGRHRRLAMAIPVLAFALLVLALDNVANRDVTPGAWLPHLMVASALGWMLFWLLDTGRLVDRGGAAHPSLIVAGVGLGGLAGSGFGHGAQWCCWRMVLVSGVGVMAAGVVSFVLAERGGQNPAMPAGRFLLSVGAALVAQAALETTLRQLLVEPAGVGGRTLGLGLVGTACLVLAVHEGRLALRLLRGRRLW